MLTVDNAKFNGRRPVFNFWTTKSAFLQFSAQDFFIGTALATEPLGGFRGTREADHGPPVKSPYPIACVYKHTSKYGTVYRY